jgi:hypothetical protein
MIGRTTREFQIAAREELGVRGVEQQWIADRAVPDDKPDQKRIEAAVTRRS